MADEQNIDDRYENTGASNTEQDIHLNLYTKAGIYATLWAVAIYAFIPDEGITIKYTLLNIPVSFVAWIIGDWCKNWSPSPDLISYDSVLRKIGGFFGSHIVSMIIGSMWLYWYMYD